MTAHDESDQTAQRRANFEQLRQLGVDVYPRRFDAGATVSDVVAAHGGTSGADLEAQAVQVKVAGRILGMRTFGKANFLVLSDGSARVQAYVRQDSVPELDFSVFRLLDFGDWVGVSGRMFRTKTNELTVWVSSLTFLAKCFLPLPEKWHGLTDVETRYRQRYLDLAVNPDSRRVFEVRSRVVSTMRTFLTSRGFLEVETPMMQSIAGGALARPFSLHVHGASYWRAVSNIRAGTNYTPRPTAGCPRHSARRVDPDVVEIGFASRHERLVPLVAATVRGRDRHRAGRARPRQRRAEAAGQRPRYQSREARVSGGVCLLVGDTSRRSQIGLCRSDEDRGHRREHGSPQPDAPRPGHNGSGYSSQPRT